MTAKAVSLLSIALIVAAGCGATGSSGTSSPSSESPATPRPMPTSTGPFTRLGSEQTVKQVSASWFAFGSVVEVVVVVENQGAATIRFEPNLWQGFSIVTNRGHELAGGNLTPLWPELGPGQRVFLGGWAEGVSAADLATAEVVLAYVYFEDVAPSAPSMSLKAPMAQVDEPSQQTVVRGLVSAINPDVQSSGVICVVLLDSDMKPIGWLQDGHTLPGVRAGAGEGTVFSADEPKLPASLMSRVFVSQAGACNP